MKIRIQDASVLEALTSEAKSQWEENEFQGAHCDENWDKLPECRNLMIVAEVIVYRLYTTRNRSGINPVSGFIADKCD
jgi:hypothetical protein